MGRKKRSISRNAGRWHEQSATCYQILFVSSDTAGELFKRLDSDKKNEMKTQYGYMLQWEPLRSQISVVGGSIRGDVTLGRRHASIPAVRFRTKRVLQELGSILDKNGNRISPARSSY